MIALLLVRCSSHLRHSAVAARTSRSLKPRRSTFDRTMRVDYVHTGGPKCRRDVRARSRRQRRPVAGEPHPARRRDQPRAVSSRGQRRRRVASCSTRAASPRSTASGKRPPRHGRRTARSTNRCGSHGRRSRCGWRSRSGRPRTTSSRRCGRPTWIPASRFVNAGGAAAREARSGRVFESGPAASKVDLLLISEGYTAGGAAEVPPRCRAAGRRAVRAGAVQEPARRLQRPGPRSSLAAERREPAERRRLPPHAALGRVQHLRFGTLRPHPRQPRAARGRGGGALRVHRNPRQRADLRRRRHLQRPGDRVGGQRASPSTSSSTSSATISPRSPTSTTRQTSPMKPAPRSRRNRGSRT